MKYAIVYWSRYGNGKQIVTYLAQKLKQKGATTQIFNTAETDPSALPKADMYVFSAPTEAFNIQKNMRKFMKNLENMNGKKYGIINTHSMKKNWLPKMEKLLAKKKMVKVAGIDFQVSKEAPSGNGLMEGWKSQLEAFADKL
jgi:flavodoxin